ncbi:MAG: AraC family transcriptional regulator [Brevundimonas sp.]|uniref:helix-turn-helix domain-containing protein n=1 Tax=Brevundimonas sp. TaxID=1871086 RepID=UPI0027374651|nr:AraC family transcriptional regulator [Brevundimonas sp.]MDP3405247.1 AraC family transcriptional regulator [Brevundimonas sp.]
MTSSVSLILNAVGLGVVVAGLGVFAVARRVGQKPLRQARLWMAAFIALLGYDQAVQIADILGLIASTPVLIGLDFLHLPPIVMALYMHVRLVTPDGADGSPETTPGPVLWPWTVVAGLWALLIPLAFLDAGIKRAVFLEGAFASGDDLPGLTQAPLLIAAIVGVLLYWLLWVALLVWAGIAMVGRLIRRERWLRTQVSTFEGLGLSPVRRLLWLCAAGIALVVTDQILVLLDGSHWPDWSSDLYVALLALSFTLLTLSAALEPEQTLPGAEAGSDRTKAAYARSALSGEDCQRILAKIDRAMRHGQLWRDPFLTLSTLSQACSVKSHQVSQALNTGLGRNFFDYVNALRVEEACNRLTTETDNVLGISEAVGFNSKSTFNAAFLKHTGMTPSQYRTGRRQLLP